MFNKFKFNFCSRQTSRRKSGSRMLEVRSWYSGWMGHLLFQGISYVVVVIFLLLLLLLSWYNGWMSHRLLLLISWKGSWRFWVQECGRQRTNWATGVPRARILYQGTYTNQNLSQSVLTPILHQSYVNEYLPLNDQERDESRDEFLVLACDGVTILNLKLNTQS